VLWQSVREVAGVSRREFDDYFTGLYSSVAIWLTDVARFRYPIPLTELRAMLHGFQPPQGSVTLTQRS
jgi:predicted transcriptional regulator